MRVTALSVALALLLAAGQAAAGCAICVESIGTQSPAGGTLWHEGEPLTLVVIVSRATRDLAFPEGAVAVVERIGPIALRKFSELGDTAGYAGDFAPDREGPHGARLRIGDLEQDVRFVVRGLATERRETLLDQLEPPLLALGAAALLLTVASAARRRRA